MDVNTTPPSAMIIAFVPRRKRPKVGVAIRDDFSWGPMIDVIVAPANCHHAPESEHEGAP
jgi:hypothetical protein